MAYNGKIADDIRELLLLAEKKVEEKEMFGGLCFMVNGKMCLGVVKDELMCRLDPEKESEVLEMTGCRPMDFTGRPMKGYVFVSGENLRTLRQRKYWVELCLAFNQRAKASGRKK